MGALGGYAKGEHPVLDIFKDLNRSYNVHAEKERQEAEAFALAMPRWRRWSYYLGVWLMKPAERFIDRSGK